MQNETFYKLYLKHLLLNVPFYHDTFYKPYLKHLYILLNVSFYYILYITLLMLPFFNMVDQWLLIGIHC